MTFSKIAVLGLGKVATLAASLLRDTALRYGIRCQGAAARALSTQGLDLPRYPRSKPCPWLPSSLLSFLPSPRQYRGGQAGPQSWGLITST